MSMADKDIVQLCLLRVNLKSSIDTNDKGFV